MRLVILKDGSMSLRNQDNILLHNGEAEIDQEIDLSGLTFQDIEAVRDNLGDKVKINKILAPYGLVI